MLCSNVNATIYCQIDAIIAGTWSCKEHSIARLSFGTGRCFAGLSFVGPFRNSFVMDATTTFNVEEDLSLKDKALLFKMDATTNLNVAEDLSWLIWFVEVTGAHTNDVKVLRKTFVMKVTDSHTNNVKTLHETYNAKMLYETFIVKVTVSNPVWDWTQQLNPGLEQKVAKRTWADITRLLRFDPCQLDGWVFNELWSLLGISLSCSWSHKTLLCLMKGCHEAMHPVPFVWLVCESVCESVRLLDRSWLP